jgi:hypothetical protein
MTKDEKEKTGLIILDTLKEYLHDINTPCWSGEVVEEHDFDNIADDLINKLFIYNVSKRFYCENGGNECLTQCHECKKEEENI